MTLADDIAVRVATLAAVPIFSGLSDQELAIIALLSISGGGGGGGGGGTIDISTLAKEVTLGSVLTELRDDVFVTSTLWEDRSGSTPVFYREERIRNQDDGTISTVYTRLSDNTVVGSLPAGSIPVAANSDRQIEAYRYRVKSGQSGTGYSAGDLLTNTIIFNLSGAGSIISSSWYNLTTSAAIAAPDPTKIEDLTETILRSILSLLPSNGIFPASQSGTWNIGSIGSLPNVVLGAGANAIGSISNTTFAAIQGGPWTVATGGLTDAQLRATPPSVIPTDGTTAISLSTSDADGTSTTSNRLRVTGHIKGYNGTTWDMIRAGVTGVVSSVTGFLNGLVFGQYNSTPPTLTNQQYAPLQLDSTGNLKVSTGDLTNAQLRASALNVIATDGTNNVTVSTAITDAISLTLNRLRVVSVLQAYNGTTLDAVRAGVTGVVSSVTGFLNGLVFGQYKSTPPTLTDGQYTSLQLDATGNLKTANQGFKRGGGTATAVTVNSSGSLILAANTSRTGAEITLIDNVYCYLFFASGAGTFGTGSPLITIGSVYNVTAADLYQGAIYGITAAGTTARLVITEFN